MRTKQITAQLYEVARDMTVKRGQYVMVVADIVVGIYTGIEAVPITPDRDVLLGERAADDVIATRKKRVKLGNPLARPTNNTHQRRGKVPSEKIIPFIEKIHAMYQSTDMLKMADVRKALGMDKNDRDAWRVRDAIYWMRDWGWVTADTIGKYHSEYERTDKMPSTMPSDLREAA